MFVLDELPDWDPNARAVLAGNQKARSAMRLLTEQVRTEAAKLQFERDALVDAGVVGNAELFAGATGWGSSRAPTDAPRHLLLDG